VKARVLVLDGVAPAAVAVVRSLVAAGHPTWVLSGARHAAAAAVRGRRGTFAVPAPELDPDGWTAAVRDRAAGGRFDVLLPVSDVTQVLLEGLAKDLPDGTIAALPLDSGLERLHDKTAVLDRAAALGIPVLPRRTGPDIAAAPLPAVLKPTRSRRVRKGGVTSATARVLNDAAGLERAAAELRAAGLGAYAEPWIPGEGRGVFLLLADGEVRARFAHRRIREASPLGGPSAVCEAVSMDERLSAWSVALARDLGVSGPFMAEFRGEHLLEVNARYWGSLGLAVDAGVDFPALHVASLTGRRAVGPDPWRTGIRRRNLAFDLRHLAEVFAGRPRGLEIPWPGRISTLWRVMVDDSPGLIYLTGDPAPGRENMARLVRKALYG